MRLYIIRHAQSTNNALLDQTERLCDPPLTELGSRQAEILARYLADGAGVVAQGAAGAHLGGYGIVRLCTSPMRRALQTAGAIGRALGLRPEVWIDIHEQGGIFLDHGSERGFVGYPGMARQEMLAECPEAALPEGVTDHGWWTGTYEDMEGCSQRAVRMAVALRQQAASDETIAMVTHGNFIDAFLKALLAHPPDQELFYYNYNTAISHLEWHRDGRLAIHYLGRVDHLPLELIT